MHSINRHEFLGQGEWDITEVSGTSDNRLEQSTAGRDVVLLQPSNDFLSRTETKVDTYAGCQSRVVEDCWSPFYGVNLDH